MNIMSSETSRPIKCLQKLPLQLRSITGCETDFLRLMKTYLSNSRDTSFCPTETAVRFEVGTYSHRTD